MNYFLLEKVEDIGNGYVMLSLSHLYGAGPIVRLPVFGKAADYTVGQQVEVKCEMS